MGRRGLGFTVVLALVGLGFVGGVTPSVSADTLCFHRPVTIYAQGGVTNGTSGSDVILGSEGDDIINGGGGGDYIWNGSEWLLSGVHSWGWQICQDVGLNCDRRVNNDSSFGDVSGSTAVFSHLGWINSVTAVPEPSSYALLLAGLAVVAGSARRRFVRRAVRRDRPAGPADLHRGAAAGPLPAARHDERRTHGDRRGRRAGRAGRTRARAAEVITRPRPRRSRARR